MIYDKVNQGHQHEYNEICEYHGRDNRDNGDWPPKNGHPGTNSYYDT